MLTHPDINGNGSKIYVVIVPKKSAVLSIQVAATVLTKDKLPKKVDLAKNHVKLLSQKS